MQDFRSVDTWKKAHRLVLQVYEESKSLPRDETLGIIMLLRQSATAIASGIAAGYGRTESCEASVDLHKAAAHCTELEYLILLTRDLALWPPTLSDELMASAIDVRTMVLGALQAH